MLNISQDRKIVSLCIRTWNLYSWNQYVYQKNINYVPEYVSGLSCALLCFFPTTFLEIAVYPSLLGNSKNVKAMTTRLGG